MRGTNDTFSSNISNQSRADLLPSFPLRGSHLKAVGRCTSYVEVLGMEHISGSTAMILLC